MRFSCGGDVISFFVRFFLGRTDLAIVMAQNSIINEECDGLGILPKINYVKYVYPKAADIADRSVFLDSHSTSLRDQCYVLSAPCENPTASIYWALNLYTSTSQHESNSLRV